MVVWVWVTVGENETRMARETRERVTESLNCAQFRDLEVLSALLLVSHNAGTPQPSLRVWKGRRAPESRLQNTLARTELVKLMH